MISASMHINDFFDETRAVEKIILGIIIVCDKYNNDTTIINAIMMQ